MSGVPGRGGRKVAVAVFLPREHLPFLRGWVEHHADHGFESFLYDNSGAEVSSRATSAVNAGRIRRAGEDKRGHHYGAYTEHMSDRDVTEAMLAELSGLPVTVKAWQPRNERGEILYAQVASSVDFIHQHAEGVDWAAFIDVDEYLWCADGLSWDDLLGRLAAERCHRLLLEGVVYESRWTPDGRPRPIKSLRCCGMQSGKGFADGMKNIVRPDKVIRADVHWNWTMADGNRCATVDPAQYYFRHHRGKDLELRYTISDNPSRITIDESLPV